MYNLLLQEILGKEQRQKKHHYYVRTPSAPPLVGLDSENNPTSNKSSYDSVSSTNGLRETEAVHSGTTVVGNIEISNPSYRLGFFFLYFFCILDLVFFFFIVSVNKVVSTNHLGMQDCC